MNPPTYVEHPIARIEEARTALAGAVADIRAIEQLTAPTARRRLIAAADDLNGSILALQQAMQRLVERSGGFAPGQAPAGAQDGAQTGAGGLLTP
jgi:hypothetical protein